MKQIYKLFALVVVTTLATACYEDKGNYDYKDINQLTINMGDDDATHQKITIGGTIESHPTIRFMQGEGDMSRLSFKWYLIPNRDKPGENTYTQDDWNALDLVWTPDFLVPSGQLRLEVTDSQTGIVYFGIINCSVYSRYQAYGALILAEKDGKSQFSFIKVKEKIGQLPSEFEVYNDVYTTENKSELPAGPIKIHEHFCSEYMSIGQLLLMTRNGAYDIGGKDFRKEIDLTEAFDGKAYPSNLDYVKDAMFMSGVDLVTDSQGHIYSRVKNTSELYHSGEFLPYRLKIEGEEKELQGCQLVMAPFASMKACLVYEASRKRFLYVADRGGNTVNNKPSEEGASRPVALPNPADTPEGFLPIDNLGDEAEIIAINYFRPKEGTGTMGYTIVFYKDGKTYCQEFVLEKDYYLLKFSVKTTTISEIRGLPGKPTLAYGNPYADPNPLLFCAVGNELYIFDRKSPITPVVKYVPKDWDGNILTDVFSGDIIAMDSENYNSHWLSVGLSDGRVLILNDTKANFPEDQIVAYDSKDYSYGEIKDLRCKILEGNNWGVNRF